MRKSIIMAAFVASCGFVATAGASDRGDRASDGSSHVERRAHDSDEDGHRGDRSHSRELLRTVSCQVAEGDRLSADALRTKLTAAGYQVWSLKPKRNGCVEAKVSQANGWQTEIYVDPATAEIKSRR
jgi:hypothetical protein